MTKITRREFLKTAGLGCAALASLAVRPPGGFEPGGSEPGWNWLHGQPSNLSQAVFATTCGECPMGCGLIVTTFAGRVLQIAGNPDHPVNRGQVCAKGMAALHSSEDRKRLTTPLRRSVDAFEPLDWTRAAGLLKDAFQKYRPDEMAFLLGPFPDHLADLVQGLSAGLGGASVLRYDRTAELEGRVSLMDAVQKLFGASQLPYFDLEHADVILSFGADLTEAWLPGSIRLAAGSPPGPNPARLPGYRVHFEPRCSPAAASADEWVSIEPGCEGLLAQALGRLCAELMPGIFPPGIVPPALQRLNPGAAAQACGVPLSQLERLARVFVEAPRKAAIPGGFALGTACGLAAGEAILALNVLVDNLGKPGGLFLTPGLPLGAQAASRPSTAAELGALIERMRSGQVKALFVHGANPVEELPPAWGIGEALSNLELFVSFSPFIDQTSLRADYIFPDRPALESWGYQWIGVGSHTGISGVQPVIAPPEGSRSTAGLLIAAVRQVGGSLAAGLRFGDAGFGDEAVADEVGFIQKSAGSLMKQGGVYEAGTLQEFWEQWKAHGGWWRASPSLFPPVLVRPKEQAWNIAAGKPPVDDETAGLYLLPVRDLTVVSGAFLKDELEESPRGSRAVKVEIHPQTARELGVCGGDTVRVTSQAGELECVVCECSTLRPGCTAILMQWGKNGGAMRLLGKEQNESGCSAYLSVKTFITKL